MSCEQDWRDELKTGDKIDAYDKFNAWNTATVIWKDVRPKDECQIQMVKVGFREYDPTGDKEDKMGKYWGYSENLDEFLPLHGCRI